MRSEFEFLCDQFIHLSPLPTLAALRELMAKKTRLRELDTLSLILLVPESWPPLGLLLPLHDNLHLCLALLLLSSQEPLPPLALGRISDIFSADTAIS